MKNLPAHPSLYQINARVYAESFRSQAHLDTIVVQAQEIVGRALAG